MPDDLLGHLIGPTAYGNGWLWTAAGLMLLVVCWYAAVFWWTAPGHSGAQPKLVAGARAALARRRAVRAIHDITNRHRTEELNAADAAAELSVAVRLFLRDMTGAQTEYLQVPEFADASGGVLAPAEPVLTELTDAQFNRRTSVDVGAAAVAAEDLVRRWT